MKISIILTLILYLNCFPCLSQDSLGITSLPEKMLSKIENQQLRMAEKIRRENLHFLSILKKQEIKILKHLRRVDSAKAKEYLNDFTSKYELFENKLKDPATTFIETKARVYNPRMDSLNTMLKFLAPLTDQKDHLKKALGSIDKLNSTFSQVDDIKGFIAQREEMLTNFTSKFAKLPKGLTRNLRKYKTCVYYYKDRIKGWKESVNDPLKVEQSALNILNKLPAFKSFMQQNGELATLFGSAVNNNAVAAGNAMNGLQTRASVQAALQQQLGSSINPQQYFQQQVQSAQAEFSALKNKLEGLTTGEIANGESPEMPVFKPNGQKHKSFLKRLDVGWNLQTGGTPIRFTSVNFPTTNDLGISIGYKLNDRSIVGVGVAYKFGLGEGFKNIAFTHDGVGLRTFMEYKITSPQKGLRQLFSNLWLSGGYEQNYWYRFGNISELFPMNEQRAGQAIWKKSGLLGLSKKVKRGKREMKIQALWDFMSYDTGVKPFVFRIGYNL